QLDWSVILGREAAPPGLVDENAKNADPNDHVQCVHSRHAEVDREEHLPLICVGAPMSEGESGNEPVVKLGLVFESLDYQEGQAERDGQEKEAYLRRALAGLS